MTSAQVFPYEICKLFKNIFFCRAPAAAPSENNEQQQFSESLLV